MRCPSCSSRPARRACPALGYDICPVCCGTRRQVDIKCPDDCPYLASARAHPPVTVRKQQDQDMALIAPGMRGLSEAQQHIFLLLLTLISRTRGVGLDEARDADVADATAALASTYETAAKGVIYEHQAGSAPARRMTAGIRTAVDQLGRERPSSFGSDVAAALRRFEKLAADAATFAPNDPTVLLDAIGRVSQRMTSMGFQPESDEPEVAQAATSESSIILP